MKKRSYLFALCQLLIVFQIAIAQRIEIPLQSGGGLQYITLEVNGQTVTFMFDTGANGVTINQPIFDDLSRKGVISSSDITGSTQATLADGSVVSAKTINIRELNVGGSVIPNVSCMVMPSMQAPPLMGEAVLRQLGNVTADFGNKKLIIDQQGGGSAYNPPSNPGIASPGLGIPTSPSPSNSLIEIYKIKLIPCSYQDIAEVNLLKQQMMQDPNFGHVQVDIEQNIPPSKAVNRVQKGSVTVRYFDTVTGQLIQLPEFIQPIRLLISANSRANAYPSAVQGENMLPLFNNNPIKNYIEIWVRSN